MVFRVRKREGRQAADGIVDPVTGFFNRRQLDADVAAGVDTSEIPTATLMIEAAPAGRRSALIDDDALRHVGWVISATVRTSDIVYRHSANSFCVLLPATPEEDAGIVARRVRHAIQVTPLPGMTTLVVSVGVAIGPSGELGDTMGRADDALVEARRAGGDSLVIN